MSSLVESVRRSAESITVDPRDRGTLDLALVYAAQIDDGGDLAKLGPALLATLEALRMSPRARGVLVKGGKDGQPAVNALDQLAGRRAGRRRAAGVDAPAS